MLRLLKLENWSVSCHHFPAVDFRQSALILVKLCFQLYKLRIELYHDAVPHLIYGYRPFLTDWIRLYCAFLKF